MCSGWREDEDAGMLLVGQAHWAVPPVSLPTCMAETVGWFGGQSGPDALLLGCDVHLLAKLRCMQRLVTIRAQSCTWSVLL